MPAEFQKATDYTLIGIKNTDCFLDDILIVSTGSNKHYVLNCLKRLDDENLRVNLPKCHFSKMEIDWLGYHISQLVISLIESETSAILALETPQTLKELRFFLGLVHLFSKFILSSSNLAQISHQLLPLLKK